MSEGDWFATGPDGTTQVFGWNSTLFSQRIEQPTESAGIGKE